MSDLKHLNPEQLRMAKRDCINTIDLCEQSINHAKNRIAGQKERLKCINQYIAENSKVDVFYGSAELAVEKKSLYAKLTKYPLTVKDMHLLFEEGSSDPLFVITPNNAKGYVKLPCSEVAGNCLWSVDRALVTDNEEDAIEIAKAFGWHS